VEVREVDQHGPVGPTGAGLPLQASESPRQRGQLLEHLEDPNDRKGIGSDDTVEPGGLETRPSHPERRNRTPFGQRGEQPRAVLIRRRLSRRHQQVQGVQINVANRKS
jgi:hypothetical protein